MGLVWVKSCGALSQLPFLRPTAASGPLVTRVSALNGGAVSCAASSRCRCSLWLAERLPISKRFTAALRATTVSGCSCAGKAVLPEGSRPLRELQPPPGLAPRAVGSPRLRCRAHGCPGSVPLRAGRQRRQVVLSVQLCCRCLSGAPCRPLLPRSCRSLSQETILAYLAPYRL